MNLFAYGTLMFPEVWARVLGEGHEGIPARLTGFKRFRISGEDYPGAVKSSADDFVRGIVYMSVSESDMEMLDLYEGELYRRETVTVITDGGESVDSVIYIMTEGDDVSCDEPDWDPEYFRRERMRNFLETI